MAGGLSDLRETLRRAGLRVPPIPAVVADSIEQVAEWEWGTPALRLDSLYNLRDAVETVVLSGPENYFALTNEGHGVNSYGLQLVLKHRWLAVGLQVGWGGAYMDEARQRDTFRELCDSLEDLLTALSGSRWEPPSGWTFVVADSEWVEEKLAAWIGPEQATHDRISGWWDANTAIGLDALSVASEWARTSVG